MPVNAKMLGNALANKMRGFEDKSNQMENPENTPVTNTFDVPVAAIGAAQEGEELAVRVVSIAGDMATLEKVEGAGEEPPPIPEEVGPPLG